MVAWLRRFFGLSDDARRALERANAWDEARRVGGWVPKEPFDFTQLPPVGDPLLKRYPQKEEHGMAEAPSERARQFREETFGNDLTVDEVAYILDVDRSTVLRYLREKVLVGYQLAREWRLPEADLRAWIAKQQQGRTRLRETT